MFGFGDQANSHRQNKIVGKSNVNILDGHSRATRERCGDMRPGRLGSWSAAFLSLACALSSLALATGQDPPPGSVCSEAYPASCSDKCTLDGQRESPCPYECLKETGVCWNSCDSYFSEGTVAYTNENSKAFDVYVPHCAARIATAKASAYVADAYQSELRNPPTVRQGVLSVPFAMFRNGPAHSGRSAHSGPLVNVTVSWTYKTGGRIFSSPTLAEDGAVYVGCADGFVYGVFDDGTIKWKYPAGGAVVATAAIGNPIGSDPTLFIGGADGTLHAVSANYGTSKWKYVKPRLHLNGEWQFRAKRPIVSSAALGEDGVAYVGADNSLFAIHAATGGGGFAGTVKWSFDTRGLVLGSPALDTQGRVFVGSMAGTLYALHSSDGSFLWFFDAEGGLYSSPALDEDTGRLYIGGVDGYLYALRASTGELLWKFRTSGAIYSSPTTAPATDRSPGVVFVGSTDWKLYAVRAEDGLLAWNQTLRKRNTTNSDGSARAGTSSARAADGTSTNATFASETDSNASRGEPATSPYTSAVERERLDAARVLEAQSVCPPNVGQGVGEDRSLRFGANVVFKCDPDDSGSVGIVSSPVYASDGSAGAIYVGSGDAAFYAVAAETGEVLWKIDVDGAVATSAAIDAQGRLYFATDTGVVYQVTENVTAP